jgi:hypothetical protein
MKPTNKAIALWCAFILLLTAPLGANECVGDEYDYGGGQGCDGWSGGCGNDGGYLVDGHQVCTGDGGDFYCGCGDSVVGESWSCSFNETAGCFEGVYYDVHDCVVNLTVGGCAGG